MATKPEYIETRLFINGEFVESKGGHKFSLYNPATEELSAELSEAREEDVDLAVAAAKAAFPSWSSLSNSQRGVYFKKIAELIRRDARELALLDSISMGRAVTDGMGMDPWACATHFEYYASMAVDIQGTSHVGEKGKLGVVVKQPYGVVGAIIPWNVPQLMLAMKVGAALTAGNTVVLKSSEKAPLTSLKFASICKEAGLPAGVLNVLSGFGIPCGSHIAHHMDIRKISFTGSTSTGRQIMIAAAKSNLKTVTLELGGKSPALVFADADVKVAAAKTAFSMTWITGQTCISNSRVYVEESIKDEFIEHFKAVFEQSGKSVANGDPSKEGPGIGPVADKIQFDRVMGFIEQGKKEGGLIHGGNRVGEKGNFIAPTIFSGLPANSILRQDEIFGPVVQIDTFTTEAEAIRIANDTEFGLYASVFTKDVSRAIRIAKALEAGTVGVNTTSPDIVGGMPFGGWKQSGVGREGYKHSVEAFLEMKSIVIAFEEEAKL